MVPLYLEHLVTLQANDNIFPIELTPVTYTRHESRTPRLPLIRVAPKTTLYYLMEHMLLRLYANVTHRVRHFNRSISVISAGKQ